MILLAADAWRALIDRGHAQHAACVRALKDLEDPLATVWPVVAEVMTGFADVPRGQDVAWEMIARGAIRLLASDESDVPAMRELMRRYSDRGMSLAEAAVVHSAERERIRMVFTLAGKRLTAYRAGGRRLKVVP